MDQTTSQSLNILAVDDSAADRILLERSFDASTSKVALHTCASAQEALDFLYRRGDHTDAPRPSACLFDVKMPGMSGIELLNAVKSDDGLRHIPVFMFSTSDAQSDIQACYAGHANGYIRKPLDVSGMNDLASLLERLFADILEYAEPR